MKTLTNLLVIMPLAALLLWLLILFFSQSPEGGDEKTGSVFLKTLNSPKGCWLPRTKEDETTVLQSWHHKKGNFFLLHQSGNVTYVDMDAFQKRISKR